MKSEYSVIVVLNFNVRLGTTLEDLLELAGGFPLASETGKLKEDQIRHDLLLSKESFPKVLFNNFK